MNTHDKYELPPLPASEEVTRQLENAFPWVEVHILMVDYARAAIKADRQRRGELVDTDLVQKWQREHGIAPAPGSREAAMVVIRHDEDGKPTVWCDPEIADLVRALNGGGVATVASCSGHGHRPGNIMLADGRVLVLCKDADEAREVESHFPGINGEAPQPDDPVVKESLTVPDGWQLVPIELTEDMHIAFTKSLNQTTFFSINGIYAALLEAAPTYSGAPKRLQDMSKSELIDLIESERDKHQIELDAIGAGEW